MKNFLVIFLLMINSRMLGMENITHSINPNLTAKQLLSTCIDLAQHYADKPMDYVVPQNSRPLTQIAGIICHNAFASKAMGYHYYQQELTLEEQFEAGALGAMLDIHVQKSKKGYHTADSLVLAHTEDANAHMTIKIGPAKIKYGTPLPLRTAFEQYAKLMKKHSDRFFFINIENRAINAIGEENYTTFIAQLLEETGLKPYVVHKTDIARLATQPKTPSLQDLQTLARKYGQEPARRLFITDSRKVQSEYLSYTWNLFKENQYSTLDTDKIMQQRSESASIRHNRPQSIMNYIPRGALYETSLPVKSALSCCLRTTMRTQFNAEDISLESLHTINEQELPKALYAAFTTKGSLFEGQAPNLYSIDGFKKTSFISAFCNIVNSLPNDQIVKLYPNG